MRSISIVLLTPLAGLVAACGPGGGQSAASGTDAADNAQAAAAAPDAFRQCSACHQVAAGRNGLGPSLAGVFGAKAGQVTDFTYSDAMMASGIVWNETSLDAYLTNPRATISGTTMAYPGLADDAKRAEVVEYLKTL